jgi:hypothetical protein
MSSSNEARRLAEAFKIEVPAGSQATVAVDAPK